MHKPITQEVADALQSLSNVLSGTLKSITLVRVCDHCQDENKEAIPYYVADPTGKVWAHLCNECFDALGCSYGTDEDSMNEQFIMKWANGVVGDFFAHTLERYPFLADLPTENALVVATVFALGNPTYVGSDSILDAIRFSRAVIGKTKEEDAR